MKGYCTKYALTQGIFEVKVVNRSDAYVYVLPISGNGHQIQLRDKKTFFESKSDAIWAAKQMAKKQMALTKKRLTELRELSMQPRWLEQ